MNSLVEKVLHRFGLLGRVLLKDNMSKLAPGSTIFIHIGKCGGRTVRNFLRATEGSLKVHNVHIRKPLYRRDLKYIIVARNPVSRIQSAFQWRYKLVVTEGSQKDRFRGEYDVLVKYGTLNTLAEALYHPDGSANRTAQKDIRKIHHIREDLAFYLDELLQECSPDQITGVLMQENLNDDILRVFGHENKLEEHRNPRSQSEDALSEVGLRNLMTFFRKDYEALVKLYCWGKIEPEVFLKAL